jgi:hypothetical protein
MPIILATQETEIRRILISGQARQIVHQTCLEKMLNTRKTAGRAVQATELIPGKCEA